MKHPRIRVIMHDVRSAHNVGSILRTADGFGVELVFATGLTPYPRQPLDLRLPHVSKGAEVKISKTALGAQNFIPCRHHPSISGLINELRTDHWLVIALEQADVSQPINRFLPTGKRIALIVGHEVNGLPSVVLKAADAIIEIPMSGHKESFNVSVAAGIALYALTQSNFQA